MNEFGEILGKYGFVFDNGQYSKIEDGIEYYIYDGIEMGSYDGGYDTIVLTYTNKDYLNGEFIIRDIPNVVYDYLLLEEREKNLNKLTNG